MNIKKTPPQRAPQKTDDGGGRTRRRRNRWISLLFFCLAAVLVTRWWLPSDATLAAQVEFAGGRYDVYRTAGKIPNMLQSLVGASTTQHVVRFAPGRVTDAWLQRNREDLAALPNLSLTLNHPQITDSGIAELQSITLIESLSLQKSRLTDKGMESLSGMSQLHSLDVSDTSVTDDCISTLNKFPSLMNLGIARTEITPEGLQRLTLPSVTMLSLSADQITPDSVNSPLLKAPLTHVRIFDCTAETLALLPQLTVSIHLTIHGPELSDSDLPMLTQYLSKAPTRQLMLLDVTLSPETETALRQSNPACGIHTTTTMMLEQINNQSTPVSNSNLW